MVKKLSIVLCVIIAFIFCNMGVLAAGSLVSALDCGPLGDPSNSSTIAYYLQWAFNIMKFAAVVLFLTFTIKDLIGGVTSGKSDEFAKLGAKTIKRFIYAVLLFFLPILIDMVLGVVGLYGTCGIK